MCAKVSSQFFTKFVQKMAKTANLLSASSKIRFKSFQKVNLPSNHSENPFKRFLGSKSPIKRALRHIIPLSYAMSTSRGRPTTSLCNAEFVTVSHFSNSFK